MRYGRRLAGGESLADYADQLVDFVADRLAEARPRFPLDDYQGRLYSCSECRSVHACVAPLRDLVDDYRCPECGTPQLALVPPSVVT